MFKSSSVPIKYFALFHTVSLFQVYNKEFTTGSTKITPAKKKKKILHRLQVMDNSRVTGIVLRVTGIFYILCNKFPLQD